MSVIQTNMTAKQLVENARGVRSLADAVAVEQAIIEVVGGEYRRPLGDVWNNFGLVSQAGDFDHKVIEAVTNAQDSILEREAMKRFKGAPIPYTSPREAAKELLDLDQKATRERIHVDFRSAGAEEDKQRKITIGVSDDGCGMTPSQMTSTILQLGSRHKSNSFYQQGAFGLGVKSTFRNAAAGVIISRRAPEMTEPHEDRVAVAVVRWEEFGKGLGAYYLTTTDWADGANPVAEPWSTRSDVDFPVGTRLILVEYQVKGLHRARSGDPRAFQAVASTRLHAPVIPFRHTSHLVKKPEPRTVYGLAYQLENDPPPQHGRDRLPFHVDGITYQLPIDWWVFPAAAHEPGGRNSKVATGHVVSFTSSGQVHHHWDKPRFKALTALNKVDDRAYVVVETDALPIKTRTRLFTPDRAALLPSDHAIRLESSVAAFLKDHDELREINGQLQRQAVESALGSRKTRAVAAAHQPGVPRQGLQHRRGRRPRPAEPTRRRKAQEAQAAQGAHGADRPENGDRPPRGHPFDHVLVGRQRQLPGQGDRNLRGQLRPPCLDASKLPHSDLLNGRIRVNVLIPEHAALGQFALSATVPQWASGAGGLAGPLHHETTLIVTDEPPAPPSNPTSSGGAQSSGAEVALKWRDDMPANEAGHVEDLAAAALAADPEYKDLAKLGDQQIPTIMLNENYSELKKYRDSKRRRHGDQAVEEAQGRYAAGIGVGLLVVRSETALEGLSDEQVAAIGRAQARTALSLMPDFDKLMAELDVD